MKISRETSHFIFVPESLIEASKEGASKEEQEGTAYYLQDVIAVNLINLFY